MSNGNGILLDVNYITFVRRLTADGIITVEVDDFFDKARIKTDVAAPVNRYGQLAV